MANGLPGFGLRDLERVRTAFDALALEYARAAPLLPEALRTDWTGYAARWGAFLAEHEGAGPFEDEAQLLAHEGAIVGWRRRLEQALARAAPGSASIPPSGHPGPPPPRPTRRPVEAGWWLLGLAAAGVGLALWRRSRG